MAEMGPYEPPAREPRRWGWSSAWLIGVTQPNVASYESLADDPSASVAKGYLWVFISALLAYGIGGLLQLTLLPGLLASLGDQANIPNMPSLPLFLLLCLVPFSALVAPLGLMLAAAMQQFVAGAFGGQGSFSRLFYVMSAYTAPITLGTTLIGLIPFIGACLALPIALYTLGLNALAVKAVNRFGWGSAVASMLIPVIVLVLVIVVLALALIPFAGGSFNA